MRLFKLRPQAALVFVFFASTTYAQISPPTLPARIEAEAPSAFYDSTPGNSGTANCSTNDLDAQTTADVGGGCNVGWTAAGEWTEYAFTTLNEQAWELQLRLSTAQTNRRLQVLMNGAALGEPIAVAAFGWQNFTTVKRPVTLPAGEHRLRLVYETGGVNVNYLEFVTPKPAAGFVVPGRIEAEAFHAAHDTTAGNSGSAVCATGDVDSQLTGDSDGHCNIGWTRAGEWLRYELTSQSAGSYALRLRVAAASGGKRIRVTNADGLSAEASIPAAGWQHYSDVLLNLPLAAGANTLTVDFPAGDVNFNYFVVNAPANTDSDDDGLTDDLDLCPATPAGATVDVTGCAASQRDGDSDTVADDIDQCPASPTAAPVDASGCAWQERDDDGDGFANPIDQCPQSPVGASVNAGGCAANEADLDGDGVVDADDLCPDTPLGAGATTAFGCAGSDDPDGDFLPNDVDACPLAQGFIEIGGCKPLFGDFDGDGIADTVDQCPYSKTPGAVNEFGCAPSDYADDDGDGLNNGQDLCVHAFGLPVDGLGCTDDSYLDADHDRVANGQDLCPHEFGPKTTNGCARPNSHPPYDYDGDGIANELDHCPYTGGALLPVGANGCALDATLEDFDGDGINNGQDLCPRTPAGHATDTAGCASMQQNQRLDSDGDGTNNALDHCPYDTLPGAGVTGCGSELPPMDMDGDGLVDPFDRCPTEAGHRLLGGCRAEPWLSEDSDSDGVPVPWDRCPFSAPREPGAFPGADTGCHGDDGLDFDADGIANGLDLCPNSQSRLLVDARGCDDWDRVDLDQDGVMNGVDLCSRVSGLPTRNGCPRVHSWHDGDDDGIPNDRDHCLYTPESGRFWVNEKGCGRHPHERDRDGDGVVDELDQCVQTPTFEAVDAQSGCTQAPNRPSFDGDNDGVLDHQDLCPSTPAGEPVDAAGCFSDDADHDGVPNPVDQCANSRFAAPLAWDGCEIYPHPVVQGPIAMLRDEQAPPAMHAYWLPAADVPLTGANPAAHFEFEPAEPSSTGPLLEVYPDQLRLHWPTDSGVLVRPYAVRLRFFDGTYSNWFSVTVGAQTAADASVLINDRAVLDAANITLLQVFDLLARENSSAFGVTLFKQLWDSQRSQSVFGLPYQCTGEVNGFPVVCDRPETQVALWDDWSAQQEMERYRLTAVVNRLDLARDWQTCGEHRLVFARQAGVGGRAFINVEASWPNPMPGNIAGCRTAIEFWSNLASLSGVAQAQALFEFFYGGPMMPRPVISPEHFVVGAGQLRTTQFDGGEWLFKEHKLELNCAGACDYWVRTHTVQENPFGPLFSPAEAGNPASPWQAQAQAFQAWLPGAIAPLATDELAFMQLPVPAQFNHGQSHASGPERHENDYLAHFAGQWASPFAMALEQALVGFNNADGSPLQVEQALARASAMSCAGCHAPQEFALDMPGRIGSLRLPDGTVLHAWPRSFDFVHINEQGELSPALREVFLPMRKALLVKMNEALQTGF